MPEGKGARPPRRSRAVKDVGRRGQSPGPAEVSRGQRWGQRLATPGQRRIIPALGKVFILQLRSCEFGMADGLWGPPAGEWRRPRMAMFSVRWHLLYYLV